MKKILLLSALCISLMSGTQAQAQKTTGAFSIDPLPLFIGAVITEAEFNFGTNFSAGPELSLLLPLFDIGDLSYFGFGIGGRLNWYPNGNTMSSFYVAPRAGYSYIKVEKNDDDATANNVRLGALVGYRWLLEGTTIKLGVGGLTSVTGDTSVKVDGKKEDLATGSSFSPAFEFSFGFRF